MNNNRTLGIHLRIEESYTAVLEQTLDFGLRSCQFFFMPQTTERYLRVTEKDKKSFLEYKNNHNMLVIAHSSYWINAATGDQKSAQTSKRMLKREIAIAKQLEIDTIVLHAGSAKKFPYDELDPTNRQRGIEAATRIINDVLANETSIRILVENTAHGGRTVCSDLLDFVTLRSLIKKPDRTKFCFDTAHAFSYGYNFDALDQFIALLEQTMGIENIALIHLNDSQKTCGSKIDQHAIPGRGLIGANKLRRLVCHPKLSHIPLIFEPPPLSCDELRTGIAEIQNEAFTS